MQGMADGCSQGAGWPISFNDILLQNVYLDLSEGHWVPEEARADPAAFLGCTGCGSSRFQWECLHRTRL